MTQYLLKLVSVSLVLGVIFGGGAFGAERGKKLKPLMNQGAKVVYQADFSKSGAIDKTEWGVRQGTRWAIAEGMLKGMPSSAEYQASRGDHQGFEARVSSPKTPASFIVQASFRFIDGAETPIAPFIEFGHHVARLRFSAAGGVALIADGESVKLDEAKDFKYESGKWYHVLAEMAGDEFVIQFADGPTLYGRHATFKSAPASGAKGFGLCGPKGGTVEIDNVTMWEINDEGRKGWGKTRKRLEGFEPVVLKEKKSAKK